MPRHKVTAAPATSAPDAREQWLRLDQQLCFALYAASRAMIRAYAPLLEPLVTGLRAEPARRGDLARALQALGTAVDGDAVQAKRDLDKLSTKVTGTGLEAPLVRSPSPIADTALMDQGRRASLDWHRRVTGKTGVEMEALTAVSVAALTVFDMIKAVDPAARIDDIRVLRKEGGKTGLWER